MRLRGRNVPHAGKKLIDTAHPAFKSVTAVRGKIGSLWKAVSLPYAGPGLRLIRQDRIERFNAEMQELRAELEEAVWRLDEHFSDLKSTTRQRLAGFITPAIIPIPCADCSTCLGIFRRWSPRTICGSLIRRSMNKSASGCKTAFRKPSA